MKTGASSWNLDSQSAPRRSGLAEDGKIPSLFFGNQAHDPPRTPHAKLGSGDFGTPTTPKDAAIPMQMATTVARRKPPTQEKPRPVTRETGFIPTMSLIEDDGLPDMLNTAPRTRPPPATRAAPSTGIPPSTFRGGIGASTATKGERGVEGEDVLFSPPSSRTPAPATGALVTHRFTQPAAAFTRTELSNPLDTDQARWRVRVVVFGLPPDSVQNVLRKFQEFGDIVDYHVGQGNWMIIRYSTALQAEKALGQTGILLSSHVMLGVMRLTTQLAKRLNIQIRDDDTVEPVRPLDKDITAVRSSREGAALKNYRRYLDVDDRDILQPPKRRKNICSQLLEAVFNW